MTILQLLGAILQKLTLPLRRRWFGGDSLDLSIRHSIDHNRREDLFQASDNVTLNDLGGDICNEGLLRDLVDRKETIEGFFGSETLHVLITVIGHLVDDLIDVDGGGDGFHALCVALSTGLGGVLGSLLESDALAVGPALLDRFSVVVVVIDRVSIGVFNDSVQFGAGLVGALFQSVVDSGVPQSQLDVLRALVVKQCLQELLTLPSDILDVV